jgi:hypothetical protein
MTAAVGPPGHDGPPRHLGRLRRSTPSTATATADHAAQECKEDEGADDCTNGNDDFLVVLEPLQDLLGR